jgi:hypothetical protein
MTDGYRPSRTTTIAWPTQSLCSTSISGEERVRVDASSPAARARHDGYNVRRAMETTRVGTKPVWVPSFSTWITTPLTREEAFTRLSRFDEAAVWDPGVVSSALVTPEPVGAGSRFDLRVRWLGLTMSLTYEVTRFDPPNELAVRAEHRAFTSDVIVTFESLERVTEIGWELLLRPRGPAHAARPLLSLAVQRSGALTAQGLRARLASQEPR